MKRLQVSYERLTTVIFFQDHDMAEKALKDLCMSIGSSCMVQTEAGVVVFKMDRVVVIALEDFDKSAANTIALEKLNAKLDKEVKKILEELDDAKPAGFTREH